MRTLVSMLVLAACGSESKSLSSGDRTYDAIAYDLHGSFDPAHVLTAHEQITVALGGSPVIELDAQVAVTGVAANGHPLAFDATAGMLRVDLSPVESAGPVTFAVDYTAEPSGSLIVGGPRDNDPIPGTVVYTDSEPDRGSRWLVGKHDPSDRAQWSVEMDIPADADLVANGRRVSDAPGGNGHVVRYELDKPIPTYMMAFATGDLAHEERTTGRVPLALWHRNGLPVDANAHFDVIADLMATFEALVGPYPWDSYAVFLAPQYGGGMENATITFDAESSGVGNISFALDAHELAHHWFGDWVTMQTYNDVWFKEGMATLLASEAERKTRDRANRGRLFGQDMTFDPTEPIVDDALVGIAKYTSGPYQRAAWLITQIRTTVGETVFWSSLRAFLAQHALGSATGEQFLRSFPLDDATYRRLFVSLRARTAPTISATESGGGLAITVSDPAQTLFAPIGVTVVDAAGTATPATLAPGATVTVPAGGYLAPDERDVHPPWAGSFSLGDTDAAALAAVMLPTAQPALAAFEDRSAATQELAIASTGLPAMTPAGFATFHAALDSAFAQRSAVIVACGIPALRTSLDPMLGAPAVPTFSSEYAACGAAPPSLASEFAQLASAPTPATLGRLDYLMSFDYGAASFAPLATVATTAPSISLRDRAVSRLALQASGVYSAVPATDVPMWQQFFRDRLRETTSATRLSSAWRGAVGLGDVGALPVVAALFHAVPMSPELQTQIVCDAFSLVGTGPAWTQFLFATMPWDSLSETALRAIADPATGCGGAPRIAPPAPSKARREAGH